jgi:hypothetical protein
MKAALIFASTVLFIQPLIAATSNCAATAGIAAFKLAHPQGNKPNSSLYVSVDDTKLVKKSGSTLYYRVEIRFDVNEGYSDSFPSETYSVLALGNERVCKVTGVKLVK